MTQPNVTLRMRGLVAEVEFFHPAHNSLPADLLAKLAACIQQTGEDDAARVIVLRSGGDRTFCAGASFDELKRIQNAEDGRRFFRGFAAVINAMRKCPKLIIARVQGKAVGGGVGLAAAADYCLASQYAAVKLSELQLGLGPFVVGPAVARKIGIAAFSQLAMDADSFYDAEWAREKGLHARVLESNAALDVAVDELANKLAGYSPRAMRELKISFWAGCEEWDALLEERAGVSGGLAAVLTPP